MTTLTFFAPRPGAWLREDIADILSALARDNTDPSYLEGLCAAGLALGLQERIVAAPMSYHPNYTAIVEVTP